MTPISFNHLAEADQTDLIWEQGAFLARRTEGYHNVLLFQIGSFYTELYYHSHFNVLIKIESFSNTERLMPYLNEIAIDSLVKDL